MSKSGDEDAVDAPVAAAVSAAAASAVDKHEEPPSRHFWSHLFNIVVIVGGGIALAVMMHELGWANAREVFEDVGGWFFLILALDLVGMGLDAAAIHAFMQPESRTVSYWKVFAAQASGRAINIFVPGGVVGEATKITMLVSQAPKDRVLSAIVLFNLATFYISVAILIIGVPITTFAVDLPHELAVIIWIGLAILIGLVIGLGVIIHRGAIDTVMTTLRGMRVISKERSTKWKTQLAQLDKHLKDLHSEENPGNRLALVLLLISRVIAWISTVVVLAAVGLHLRPMLIIGVLSVGVLIAWISAVVPLGLGIADGSNYALFGALGSAGADGVFVTLLNRARTLAVALIGLAIMALAHTSNHTTVKRRHRDYVRRTTQNAKIISS
ncbi:MAG: lysylphosphatidylglycerol synthase transmembrane domain-containing protein [Kofleriaceae bacterium]